MPITMVTHAKLQYYRHNYGLVCITGLLGCRWHRYKQSTRDSRKRDLVAFTLVLLTFLFMTFYLYFVLIAKNDFDDLNWYMFTHIHKWIPFYTILLAVICILFTYFVLIMILYLCHIIHGHQLYTHPLHIFLSCVCVSICIALTVVFKELWESEWIVIYLSLQMMGPFLQIGSVILMTSLAWIIIGQCFTLSRWYLKTFWLCVFAAVMVVLYISPLFINAPCVITWSSLPPKPKIVAHRGASRIAPENTMISFQKAVQYDVMGFETDVQISHDGVPFLMHDQTLERTTNVANIFPEEKSWTATSFNISQLQQLNAGDWFLQNDPMMTVRELSDTAKQHYKSQHIPTFMELLQYANTTGTHIIFDTKSLHPYYNLTDHILQAVVNTSSIPKEKVFWFVDDKNVKFIRAQGYTPLVRGYHPVEELKKHNISYVNAGTSQLTFDNIREYKQNNISTNMYLVNTPWLFSLYWCLGVTSVSTNACHTLHSLEEPVWTMAPRSYLIMWITVDVLSAVIVVVIFIVQRIQRQGMKFSPESVSLNSGQHGSHRNQRSDSYRRNKRLMKEKLLMRDVAADLFDVEPELDEFGIESNYTVTSTDGRILARTFLRDNDRHHGTFQTSEPVNSSVRYEDPTILSEPIHNL